MNFGTILSLFFHDPRTQGLGLLIVADLVLGIIAALKQGEYQWRIVGNWYRTNVVPYILGYLLVWTFLTFGLGDTLGPIWLEISQTVGVGPAIGNLVSSIAGSLAKMKTP